MRFAITLPRSRTVPSTPLILAGILAAAFLARLVLVPAAGFASDVGTFEAWSLLLDRVSPHDFYGRAGFADYPPGYFFVLWIVGRIYSLLLVIHPDPGFGMLQALVKMPAIVMDLASATIVFAIVRRFAPIPAALASAAILAFDPSILFISAYWGQVDSVAAAFALFGVYGMLRAYDAGDREFGWILGAWSSLAYSLLIKPQAAVLIPLFIAFTFVSGRERVRRRLAATGAGIVASFALAYAASLVFHAGWNPVDQFRWLLARYEYASSVYPYDSVNAFNLYAVFLHFWEPDNILLPSLTIAGHTAGLTRGVWGLILLGVAGALVVSRYLGRKDAPALLEGSMILALGFFVLSTRMHERYSFDAVVLAIPLACYRRRYFYATIVLSLTLFANLVYSMYYLRAMNGLMPGADATDLMPFVSRPLSAVNVLTLFYLGYVFLGSATTDAAEERRMRDLGAIVARLAGSARSWFSPIEGLARMTTRDWSLASGLSLASFGLSFANYWWPSEKYFDEVYYPRAGEEYLTHANFNGWGVFEFTHPPLTKLVITLSMILFGGMAHGDNGAGWRFLNLVAGALMVLVCYAFAKAVTSSTRFAAIAAGLMLFDGFHYVQSRIATPEITVALFSLTTLFCFYRYWIASQVRIAPVLTGSLLKREAVVLGLGTIVAAILAYLTTQAGTHQPSRAFVLAFLYFELGAYLFARLVTPRIVRERHALRVSFASGEAPEVTGKRSGITYRTPGGTAAFTRTPHGPEMHVTSPGDAAAAIDPVDRTIDARESWRWFWALTVSAGCLAASKWNGLFDFFVVWACAIGVALQPATARALRALRGNSEDPGARAAGPLWGNPLGTSVDVLIVAMLFVGMTIYALTYIPFFALGNDLDGLIGLQQQMYWYHANLKATHLYGSSWWQWPLLLRPIAYYYHDFRSGAATQDPTACCVAEILALPNPLVWWSGLLSVPYVAYLGWRERSKGYVLLVTAYFFQWAPWIVSPRVAFEYHFFPNLAIICIADAIALQRIWRRATPSIRWPRHAVNAYLVLAVLVFAFFFPILSGTHVTWATWDARMFRSLMGARWV